MNQKYLLSSFTYKVASWIEDTYPGEFTFYELINETDVDTKFYKFHKDTILHEYIMTYIFTFMEEDIKENPENYIVEPDEPVPFELEELLRDYKFEFQPFSDYIAENNIEADKILNNLYNWFTEHDEAFNQLWEVITEEVFYILFSNRRFLMKFHKALTEYIETENVELDNNFLKKNGKIRRTAIPVWVKKAVYCRDKARCVLCNKDLSGILSTDRKAHYDHIVALNLFGTNDPTNIQLLCEKCNLEKSGTVIKTDYKYPTWW